MPGGDWQEPDFDWAQAHRLAADGGDERPTWAYEWPAGQRLAQALIQDQRCRGKRVVDLGCGRGPVGKAALASGAREVVFADSCSHILAYLDAWIAHNELTARARTWQHRWGEPVSEPAFDLVLGGDVCYRPECQGDLIASVAGLLAEDGLGILSDPRQRPEPALREFSAEYGLHLELTRTPGHYTELQLRWI